MLIVEHRCVVVDFGLQVELALSPPLRVLKPPKVIFFENVFVSLSCTKYKVKDISLWVKAMTVRWKSTPKSWCCPPIHPDASLPHLLRQPQNLQTSYTSRQHYAEHL